MHVEFDPGQNFDCTMCGRCCCDIWKVGVDEACRSRLAGSDLVAELRARGPVLVRGGSGWRAAVCDGHCVFLDGGAKCSIQARYGEGAKPQGCTQFPFLLVQTPEGLVVGASFFCPAIQSNHGRPLPEWESWLGQFVVPGGVPSVGFQPVEAGRGRSLDWAGYLELERGLLADLEAPERDQALFHRLVRFCRRLSDQDEVAHPYDPILLALRPYLMATLVGTLEAASPQEAPRLTRDFLFAERVRLAGFGWEGDPGCLLERLQEPGPQVLDSEIARYLRALVLRKWPAQDRPVVCNLVLLALLPWLARCYAWAAAASRGEAAPALEDVHRALAWLELKLVTHTSGLEPLLSSLAEAVLRQVEGQSSTCPRPAALPDRSLPRAVAAAMALLLGLAVLFHYAAQPATASVALVVEEPAGRGSDPDLLRVLRDHRGSATVVLEVDQLRNLRAVEELVQAGEEVGAVLHPGTAAQDLDGLRQLLERKAHVHLDTVYADPSERPSGVAPGGYRVVQAAVIPLASPEEAERFAQGLGDARIVVVKAGPSAEALVRALAHRGIRVTPLAHGDRTLTGS